MTPMWWLYNFLELLLPGDAVRVREVAVECEEDILHLRIDRVVKAFDGIDARGHAAERFVHLCHILEIKSDVPFWELRRGQAELAPRNAIAHDVVRFLQVTKVDPDVFCEFQVADAGFQVEPNVVHVHCTTPLLHIADSDVMASPSAVMPALVAGIHDFLA